VAVSGQAVAEARPDTVVKAGIIQLHGQGVLEIDAAAHRPGHLPVRQVEQELQHTDGDELGRGQFRPPIPRVPGGEVLISPQPIQPATHIAVVPRGLLARATRAVSSGTSIPIQGRRDT
jgi:hypothetical protein